MQINEAVSIDVVEVLVLNWYIKTRTRILQLLQNLVSELFVNFYTFLRNKFFKETEESPSDITFQAIVILSWNQCLSPHKKWSFPLRISSVNTKDFSTYFERFNWDILLDIYFRRHIPNIAVKFLYAIHKKWSFPLRVSSLNMTKFTGSCGFCHIYLRHT